MITVPLKAYTNITHLTATANILRVECNSSFYCYDAEDSLSVDDVTRLKMKLIFENN